MFEGLSGRALAPRSRNDVPVDLPDVHAAAGRRRGVSRGDRPAARRRWPTVRRCPDAAFEDALNARVTQNHLRARPMSPEFVAQMNLDKSLTFYKERYADASDFTFVFVGSFDLPTIKPLVERYLGSLPALTARKPGATSASGRPRRRREGGHPRQHATKPGRGRLHRAVPEHREEPRHDPHDGEHAGGQPPARASRGPRGAPTG